MLHAIQLQVWISTAASKARQHSIPCILGLDFRTRLLGLFLKGLPRFCIVSNYLQVKVDDQDEAKGPWACHCWKPPKRERSHSRIAGKVLEMYINLSMARVSGKKKNKAPSLNHPPPTTREACRSFAPSSSIKMSICPGTQSAESRRFAWKKNTPFNRKYTFKRSDSTSVLPEPVTWNWDHFKEERIVFQCHHFFHFSGHSLHSFFGE